MLTADGLAARKKWTLMVSGGRLVVSCCSQEAGMGQECPVYPRALTAGTERSKEVSGQRYHVGHGGILQGGGTPTCGGRERFLPPEFQEQRIWLLVSSCCIECGETTISQESKL